MRLLLLFILVVSIGYANPIKNKAIELTRGKTTDLEKIKSISDWIHTNINYDRVLASCNSCSREWVDDPSFVFNNRKGVCSGYSNLFKYMCDSIGIKTFVVRGITAKYPEFPHAWNMSLTKNGYVFVDATWGLIHTQNEKHIYTKSHVYDAIYSVYNAVEVTKRTGYNYFLKYPDDRFIFYPKLNVYDSKKEALLINDIQKLNDYLTTESKVQQVVVVEKVVEVKKIELPPIITLSKKEFKKLNRYVIFQQREQLVQYMTYIGREDYRRKSDSYRGDKYRDFIDDIRKEYQKNPYQKVPFQK